MDDDSSLPIILQHIELATCTRTEDSTIHNQLWCIDCLLLSYTAVVVSKAKKHYFAINYTFKHRISRKQPTATRDSSSSRLQSMYSCHIQQQQCPKLRNITLQLTTLSNIGSPENNPQQHVTAVVPGSRVCIAVTPTVLAVRPTFSVARDHSPSDEQPDPTEPAGHQAGRYRTTSCFPSLDRCELRSVIVLMLRVWFENTTTWCCCVVDSG